MVTGERVYIGLLERKSVTLFFGKGVSLIVGRYSIDGGPNVYAMANLNPLFFVDPYGLSAFDWISNGLSFVGGALQVAAGFTIAATTGWTGVGAVAGAALMVNGGASMVASGANMYNLAKGNDPSLNTSGAIGLTTSLITDDPKVNAVASGADIVVNFASGAAGCACPQF